MIEIVKNEEIEELKLVSMPNMEPLQVEVIVTTDGRHNGNIVMRTASATNFEVMNLSHSGKDKCWTTACSLSVRLLPANESVTLKVTNSEK